MIECSRKSRFLMIDICIQWFETQMQLSNYFKNIHCNQNTDNSLKITKKM